MTKLNWHSVYYRELVMSISVTADAAKHIRTMLEKRGNGIGLRFGTKQSGCSGFAYTVDFADRINNDDHVFDSNGVKIMVADADLPRLQGTQIDYTRTNALCQGFSFDNPNVKNQCGCGESFNT